MAVSVARLKSRGYEGEGEARERDLLYYIHWFADIVWGGERRGRQLGNYPTGFAGQDRPMSELEICFPCSAESSVRFMRRRAAPRRAATDIVRNFWTSDFPHRAGESFPFFVGGEFRNRRPSEIIPVILNSSAR